jgi:hypothetical protein
MERESERESNVRRKLVFSTISLSYGCMVASVWSIPLQGAASKIKLSEKGNSIST